MIDRIQFLAGPGSSVTELVTGELRPSYLITFSPIAGAVDRAWKAVERLVYAGFYVQIRRANDYDPSDWIVTVQES